MDWSTHIGVTVGNAKLAAKNKNSKIVVNFNDVKIG